MSVPQATGEAGSLGLLGRVGNGLRERGEAQQDDVPLVGLGLLEERVCSMQAVQHPQDSVALIELEMVEVVEFRRGEERQVVAAVRDGCSQNSKAEPHHDGSNMGSQDYRTHQRRQHVGKHVLDRMSIEGDYTNGGCPFMVLLVYALVQKRVMNKPV